jgi:hypothetical protein
MKRIIPKDIGRSTYEANNHKGRRLIDDIIFFQSKDRIYLLSQLFLTKRYMQRINLMNGSIQK